MKDISSQIHPSSSSKVIGLVEETCFFYQPQKKCHSMLSVITQEWGDNSYSYKNIIFFFLLFITKDIKLDAWGENQELLRYTQRKRYGIFSELLSSSFCFHDWYRANSKHLIISVSFSFFFQKTGPFQQDLITLASMFLNYRSLHKALLFSSWIIPILTLASLIHFRFSFASQPCAAWPTASTQSGVMSSLSSANSLLSWGLKSSIVMYFSGCLHTSWSLFFLSCQPYNSCDISAVFLFTLRHWCVSCF